jgi:hypothetical protein
LNERILVLRGDLDGLRCDPITEQQRRDVWAASDVKLSRNPCNLSSPTTL